MQASSCNFTNFRMQSKRQSTISNRQIGANEKSIESYRAYWDSIKRKKIEPTDWTETNRTVGEQGGNLSDNCVFTRARLSGHISTFGGTDTLSPKRASNHRYGPGESVAIGRRHFVSGRFAGAHRFAGAISSSGWTQHADNWWVRCCGF